MVHGSRIVACATFALVLFGCSGSSGGGPIEFGPMGSISEPEGLGSFRFGAATAATQIEDQNEHTDWYYWTLPVEEGGLGEGHEPIGDAVRGYTLTDRDIEIMQEMGLETYRFSIEWARIEPERDVIDEAALEHYSEFVDKLIAAGIRPMITLHHFSNPAWVHALGREVDCPDGPTDENLCGWDHPEGRELILEEIRQHAALIAERFGDRVDDWCTINEPVNYIIAGWGAGMFPPGRTYLLSSVAGGLESTAFQTLIDVFAAFISAHAVMYDAIKEHDVFDADGDGVTSSVGLTLNVIRWEPVRRGELSDHPDDIAATERVRQFYHYLFVDSILNGSFDRTFDQVPDVERPDWEGRLDWLGLQYYLRNGVTANATLKIPGVEAMICFEGFRSLGGCLDVQDETKWIPTMHYEYLETGFYDVMMDFTERYPGLPLMITEAGVAAENGIRRAENVVRTLEQVARANDSGADVRGYYHWSLTDNFEWHEGYGPRFGLYRVDRETFERTPSEGAIVYGEIIESRTVTREQRALYGGTGPMTPEFEDE